MEGCVIRFLGKSLTLIAITRMITYYAVRSLLFTLLSCDVLRCEQ